MPDHPLIPPHSRLHWFIQISSLALGPIFYLCAPSEITKFMVFHAIIQFTWFTIAAAIPAYVNKVMYYVDFAWPFGVSIIALATYYFTSDTCDPFSLSCLLAQPVRKLLMCSAFFLHGARMGAGATWMLTTGVWSPNADLPRYQFAKIREEHFGRRWDMLIMQKEIYTQGFANSCVLFFPCILCALDEFPALSSLEIAGFSIWALGWTIESIADGHKIYWTTLPKETRGSFCNVGLWKYSRHPNYFGEWTAWNGLIVAAVQPLLRLEMEVANPNRWLNIIVEIEIDALYKKLALFFPLVFLSASMYYCLSEWTGAIPAEYFSAQKRAGYTTYQKTTSMIIPWFVNESEGEVEVSVCVKDEKKVEQVLTTVQKAFNKLKKKAEASRKERGRSKTPEKTAVKSRGKSKTPARSKTPVKKTPVKEKKTPVKEKKTPAKKSRASPSPRRTRNTPAKGKK